MLTVDELIELEVLITEEIEKLRERSEESAEEREAISPDVSIGRLSRLDAMQIQEIAKEGERRRQERLPRLEHALDLIDMGEYGICERCKEWIPFARLKEQPETLLCAGCA
ncbi:MAG: TraR/DksA C4-type zinc finger protein [Verrucomicrobiales bacterium]|nr:TraR/DksA C4-type zinc finger protein [Verrucomicrobiales bacterium]